MKDDYNDFVERFNALADEAFAHGVSSLVVLIDVDPISGQETRDMEYRGGQALAAGLAHWVSTRIFDQ